MIKYLTNILFLLMMVDQVSAQSFEKAYANYISSVRSEAAKGIVPALPYELLRDQKKIERVLPAIDQTLNDSLVAIRKIGYQSLAMLQMQYDDQLTRQRILGIQFKGLEDEDFEIQTLVMNHMNEADASLFTPPQTNYLIERLKNMKLGTEVLLEIVGKFNDPLAILTIRPLSLPGNAPKVRWAAYKAMARLGDAEAIATIRGKVKRLEINSDVVYGILPDLIYTYQKELYDLLVEELHSDARNCEPADPDQTRPINCAYRILEMIAPHVADFPIGVSASGDLNVRNYKKALQMAREWFTNNPNYLIVSESE